MSATPTVEASPESGAVQETSDATEPKPRPLCVIGAVALVLLGLSAAVLYAIGKVFSGSVDLANHYALVHWIYDHVALPAAPDANLGDMAFYPPGSHALAAMAGRLVGSPMLGMQVISLASVALIWLAIAGVLGFLPGIRRWIALGVLALILLLAAPNGPLPIQLHGWEIISNYFFAQVVGQVAFWVALFWVAWCMRRRMSFAWVLWPLAITTVLCTEIHLVGASETLGLLWLMSIRESVTTLRRNAKLSAQSLVPIVVAAIVSVVVAASPGFAAMRKLSQNDGSLPIPGLSSVGRMLTLTIVVIMVSVALLFWSRTRRLRETTSGYIAQVLSFGAIAIALPCLSQAAILSGGEGSAYAVKKYAFALVTMLVVELCLAIALIIPESVAKARPVRCDTMLVLRSGAAAAVALIAVFALFRQPPTALTSNVLAMETQIEEYSRTVVETTPDHVNVAYALPATLRVMDFGFTMTALGTEVTPALMMIDNEPTSLGKRLGDIVTAADSVYGLRLDCRKTAPVRNVVVVDGQCILGVRSERAATGNHGEPKKVT